MASAFDIDTCRSKFPALAQADAAAGNRQQQQIFLDNAGGSQVLGSVVESVTDYLVNANVQLGGSYHVSKDSTNRYEQGYRAAAEYIGADRGEVVVGSSTTQLFRNLSLTLEHSFSEGDEIILSKLDHEANLASWVDLASRKNLVLKWWIPTSPPDINPVLTPSSLAPLLTPRTRLVACTHASNILGTIHDISSISKLLHDTVPNALLCVDAVAYAPHRQISIPDLGGVDFYAFSWYKVYGPHVSILYASPKAQKQLRSLGHAFNPHVTLENKMGLAGASYELVQSLVEVVKYFGTTPEERAKSWEIISRREEELLNVLLPYLKARKDVTVFGGTEVDTRTRVPTISFLIKGYGAKEVVERVEALNASKGDQEGRVFNFRWGKFYSNRLIEEVLGVEGEGVVRVSAVHYNTVPELQAFVRLLDEAVPPR